jgi:glycosyltransferase involved in cell wall biosynthesis
MTSVIGPPDLDRGGSSLLPAGAAPSTGLLSTFPPTQCGLATFTSALRKHLLMGDGAVGVVRVVDEPGLALVPGVVAHLVNGSPASAAAAATVLNAFDSVVVQHEYGIFGGADGEDVLALLADIRVPLVVVLHTVLVAPTTNQRRVLERILATADAIVTMTDTARDRLLVHYGAAPAKVSVIPHGAVDHRGVAPRPRADERPLVLTWGLLGPGKGIEWAIDAMADLRDLRPRYLVVGKTHPKVHDREGEAYRDALRSRVRERELEDLVELDDAYLDVPALAALVASADVVLLPYDSADQVTSGVLTEAVAAGRPVVSTGFPHAVELLANGPGLIVPRRDPDAIAAALRRVLTEPGLAHELGARAVTRAPDLMWAAVADRYRALTGVLRA